MNVQTRSASLHHQLPATQTYQLLNNQLTIFLRPWGSTEFNQKVVDEITHYLSTTQADIEVTTPFDYLESLSSLANRTRVAVLLAHDLLYKTDNRTEYVVGFELMVLFTSRKEMAWASVGRFSLSKLMHDRLNEIVANGTDLDSEVLLPVQLIGLEKEISVNAGSVAFDSTAKLAVSSGYNCEFKISDASSDSHLIEAIPSQSTYWFSVVTPG
jgi:hypothetical protein